MRGLPTSPGWQQGRKKWMPLFFKIILSREEAARRKGPPIYGGSDGYEHASTSPAVFYAVYVFVYLKDCLLFTSASAILLPYVVNFLWVFNQLC